AVLTRETTTLLQEIMLAATDEGVTAAASRVTDYAIRGHAATAYSGPEATRLQWFIGMITYGDEAVVAVVVIEDAPSPASAAQVGGSVLDAAAQTFAPPLATDTP
ncbi:MAG: hypothetical protein JW910_21755, partial [Anaerolineae bacterium]|nr:hypothetical protein [Anaerolineae bacterium]